MLIVNCECFPRLLRPSSQPLRSPKLGTAKAMLRRAIRRRNGAVDSFTLTTALKRTLWMKAWKSELAYFQCSMSGDEERTIAGALILWFAFVDPYS